MCSCQQYRQLLLISPGLLHLHNGCKEGLKTEGLISEGAYIGRGLYPRGLLNGGTYIRVGLYIFVRGFRKAYKRRGLYPRGLLNGGTYPRGLVHLRKGYTQWGL